MEKFTANNEFSETVKIPRLCAVCGANVTANGVLVMLHKDSEYVTYKRYYDLCPFCATALQEMMASWRQEYKERRTRNEK